MICNLLVRTLQYFLKKLNFFDDENIKKLTSKVAYLWQFFSLQPRLPKTAQNWISVKKILVSNDLGYYISDRHMGSITYLYPLTTNRKWDRSLWIYFVSLNLTLAKFTATVKLSKS